MGGRAELLSLFIICAAYIILLPAGPVNGCQPGFAVLAVEAAGKKIDVDALASVAAVMAAFFRII